MNIEIVWNNIKQHEGETFHTIKGIDYQYTICADSLMINNLKSRRITKKMIEKALMIENPTPGKIGFEGCRGPSYVYGIITDKRIKGF